MSIATEQKLLDLERRIAALEAQLKELLTKPKPLGLKTPRG